MTEFLVQRSAGLQQIQCIFQPGGISESFAMNWNPLMRRGFDG